MMMKSLIQFSALCLLTASPALGAGEPPTAFGKARFGMSAQQVRELHPALETLDKMLGAAVVKGPNITRYVLWKQEIPNLPHPADVEFRFWDDKLWIILVYFGENQVEAVQKAVREQYGPPDQGDHVWRSEEVTVFIAAKNKWYSVQSNAISAEAQKVFMEDVKRAMEKHRHSHGHPPAATSPPAPTPVP